MIYLSVVSFSLGLILEKYLLFGPSFALLVLTVSAISGLILFKNREQAFLVLLIGLSFGFGILRMSFAHPNPDPILLQSVGQKISFEATIADEPDKRDTSTRYTVSSQKSNSKILLVADRFPEFQYGDQVLIAGKLEEPKNFTPETTNIEFDYVSYLAKDKIHFLVYQPEITKLKEGQGNRMIATLYLLKNKFIENINAAIPEPNSSLLNGVILGAKQSLGEKLLTDFKNVGLIHIVVLSGYNLTLIIVGVLSVAAYFGKRKLGFVVSIFLLIIFSLMVGLGATVIRAAIMALIAILAKHLGRPNDALRALFVAGILMLLWNPLLLTHDPSFQLSFMATLGLILFSPFLETWISRQKWSRFIPIKGGVREILASTFAVQLFLLPFLIKMSGTFSLISFLVNLIVLPLVPTLMFLGFATGLSGFLPFIGKFVAWLFSIPSYVLSQTIILVTEFSVQLPFSFIQISSLPTWLVLFWYSGYAFLFWKLKQNNSASVPCAG